MGITGKQQYVVCTYYISLLTHAWHLQEAAHTEELAQWDAQIRARNDELTRLTSENTRCLTAVAEYTRSQMDMEHTLANTQVQIPSYTLHVHAVRVHPLFGCWHQAAEGMVTCCVAMHDFAM